MARSDDETKQDTAGSPLTSDRTCLLVVGMHRSGTSALARVLSLMGADLPRTLMRGSEAHQASNATGHWESEAAARLGDMILDSAGTDWRSPEPVPAAWYRSARYGEMRDQAVALLLAEFGTSLFFVFKDPRISKLLPFWLDVLDRMGAHPKVVSIVRSPLEVAASLQARNGFDLSIGQLLWLRYVLDGEATSRGVPRTFVTYDQLLDNAGEVTGRIGAALDLIWPRDSFRTAAEISDFLSREHRHHSRDLVPTAGAHRGLTPLLADVYTILTRWAAEDESPSDRPVLDRARAELDRALALLGEPLRLVVDQGSKIRRFEREHDAHRLSFQEQKKALADAVRAQKEAEEKQAIARTEIENLRLEAAVLETARADTARRRQESQAALARTEKQLLAAEAARAEARLTAVEKELKAQRHAAAIERKLADQIRIAADRQSAIEHLRQDRARKVAERDRRNEELQSRIRALQNQITLAQAEREGRARAKPLTSRISRLLGLPGAAAAETRAGQLATLRASKLFDPWWYLEKYEDVRLQGLDPADHYLDHGGPEGRSPGPGFDAPSYLAANADVREAGINPLLHYIEHGQLEGRDIRPVGKEKKQGALPPSLGASPLARAFAQKPGSAGISAGMSHAIVAIPPATVEDADPGAWRARALSFSSLAWFADLDRRIDMAAAGPMTGGRANDDAARAWMLALSGSGGVVPEQPAEAALRRRLCDGQLTLADVWFEIPAKLRLHLRAGPGGPPLVLRAFQHDDEGELSPCGQAALASGGHAIVDVRMVSPYRPLLLVVEDAAGTSVDNTLLPFPSLCRGGPHFGELDLAPEADSALSAACELSCALLAKWSAVASGDATFALADIMIDIAGANGTEPALAPDLLTWLIHDLGVAVTVGAESENDAAAVALRADVAALARSPTPRAGSASLDLPATGIPTLAILFALAGELTEDICRSIHMHPEEGLASYSLAYGLLAIAGKRGRVPGAEGSARVRGGNDGGTAVPLVIHWTPPAPASPRAFFPVGAGISLVTTSGKPADSGLSVLIDCSAEGPGLVPLLLSVARLRSDFDLDCILIIDPHNPAPAVLPADLGMDVRRVESAAPTRIERLVEAAGASRFERLLLLDRSIVLHDPRAAGAMRDALEAPGIGALSCALVCEAAGAKGIVRLHRTAGWIATSHAESRTLVEKPDLAHHALPPHIPVVAPDLRCVMMNRTVLRDAGGVADDELSLGLAIAGKGLASLCLGFVTATAVEPGIEAGRDVPVIPPYALHLRSLLR